MDGEVVSSRIKATESTTLAKLGFVDQIKLLLHKFGNEDVAELDAAEKLSTVALKMRASLQRLFIEATKDLESGERQSVTIKVSSKYLPYIDNVIHETQGLGRYYLFEIYKKDLPLNVDYMFVVKVKRKVT